MSDWSLDDLLPGDPAGLPVRYAAVPAAEERDLLDEALDAEHREDLLRLHDEIEQPWDIPEEPESGEDDVLRMLRKAFNAVVILEYDQP